MGSVNAILENDIRRMIAFSSVAQIGYIYMGMGLEYHIEYDHAQQREIVQRMLFQADHCRLACLCLFGLFAHRCVQADHRFHKINRIGYIYMGMGLGTTIGIVASIFHILSHASTKSLLKNLDQQENVSF